MTQPDFGRILHVITGLDVGGAERMLLKVCQQTEAMGARNTVISLLPPGEIGAALEAINIPVLSLNLSRGAPSLTALWRLRQWIRDADPLLVHAWMYHACLAATLANVGRNTPLLWNLRCSNMDFSRYRWLSRASFGLSRMMSRFAQGIIINSQAGLDYHKRQGFRSAQWTLIGNGFDTQDFSHKLDEGLRIRQSLNISSNATVVGTVGRWDPAKDYETLFGALAIVNQTSPIELMMVGEGLTNHHTTLKTRLNQALPNIRCHLVGAQHDIPAYLNAMDIFVSSSAFGEGFPNVVGEAMSVGKPVVATNVGDTATVIGDSRWIAEPKNERDLAKKIIAAINLRADERESLGKTLRTRVIDHYGIAAICTEYMQCYSAIAGAPLPTP